MSISINYLLTRRTIYTANMNDFFLLFPAKDINLLLRRQNYKFNYVKIILHLYLSASRGNISINIYNSQICSLSSNHRAFIRSLPYSLPEEISMGSFNALDM